MKKITSLLLALFVLCIFATAQDSPKSELFGGYSYLRTDEEEIDLLRFGLPGRITQRSANLNGWNASVTYNPASWLGFIGDFSGHYGKVHFDVVSPGLNGRLGIDGRVYSFLFGPQFSKRKDSKTVFGRVMVGAVRTEQSEVVFGERIVDDATAFAFAVGGGFDLKLTDRIAWRAIQGDVIVTRFAQEIDGQRIGSTFQPNLRLSTGFVFRNKD